MSPTRFPSASASRAATGRASLKVRPVAVTAALALALALTACTTGSPSEATASRAYPAGLVTELSQLRQSSGLFSQPGDSKLGQVSLYSTALYRAAGVVSTDSIHLDSAELAGSNESGIVTGTWFTWSYVTLVGGTSTKLVSLPAYAGLSLKLPPKTDDIGQEIGLLWAWVDTTSRVTPAVPDADRAAARSRLSDIDPSEVSSPYLLWRLSSALHILGVVATPALSHALTALQPPTSLGSVKDILDTQGYLELRPKQAIDVSASTVKDLKDRLRHVDAGDDLVNASLLRSLELTGHSDTSVADAVREREDDGSGLVRREVTLNGSIEGTFRVAQLIPQDFPKIATAKTKAALKVFIQKQTDAAPIDRLEAVASLRLAGFSDWRTYQPLIESAARGLPAMRVTADTLPSVVQLIDVLRVVDQNVATPTLQQFPVVDQQSEYLARLALGNRDMFQNSDQIGNWFPTVQKSLIASSKHPTEPVLIYMTGLQGLSGAQNVTVTSADQRAIASAVTVLRGCPQFPDLYRSALADKESCSLQATRIAIDSSYAYDEGH